MTATKIFEINATYKTYETGEIVKVIRRSMSSLTILINGETLQKRFKLNDDGVEFLQLSKWETVYADDVTLIGREVVFQKKQHATVIEEFKATDESELEYGEDWIKIRLDKGTIISLAKDAKTLDWIS